MRNPFTRKAARDPQVERALRESLAEHARQAPAGDKVTDRVLAAVERGRPAQAAAGSPARWRTWVLPVVAAGSVAAVVGAVVGIQQLDRPTHRNSAVASPSVPTSSLPESAPPTVPIPTTSAPTRPTSTAPVDTSTLHGVDILDLTFADVDDGWALATADCITGPGRCAAMLRTHDGTHWHSVDLVDFNVPGETGGCTDPCVQHIRFATDRIGYAFGPKTFMMTTDGGRHWAQQPGGALFLETLNQNVIRVTGTDSGCPGPCVGAIQTAELGGSTWTTRLGPLEETALSVSFSRSSSDAYLLIGQNVAGGGNDATSTLYRSSDDGVDWTRGGEPCPQVDNFEDDSTAVAAAPDGRVTVLCAKRSTAPFTRFVATSVDHGVHFTAQPGQVPVSAAYGQQLAGDPTTVLAVGGKTLARSTDGGDSWTTVPYRISGITFVGFENTQVGRVVAADGSEIWTTRDAGKSWTKVLFR